MGAFGVPKDATGGRVARGGGESVPAGRSFFGAGRDRNMSGGGTGKHRARVMTDKEIKAAVRAGRMTKAQGRTQMAANAKEVRAAKAQAAKAARAARADNDRWG